MTSWTRTPATALALLTTALLGWGVYQGVAALRSDAAQARLAPTLNLEAFLEGRTMAAVNYVLAHHLPADPWVRAAGGLFRWGIFNSGGPAVRVGCEGWLFLTEELRPFDGADSAMAARVDALRRIQAALEARGIALVVAVVPDKARVHQDMLCGAPRSAQAEARLPALEAALSGLPQAPLLPALSALAARAPAYWRTDTHWNQQGAATAAAAIAEATRTLPFERRPGIATTRAPTETEAPADLLRLMGLDIIPDPWRPRRDRQHEATTTVPAGEGGGLLDEAVPEVVLLGSSYSLNANFHGALQQALGAAVTSLAQAGGGFHGAAAAFFGGATFRETPPRLVIWEFPERVMGQPISPAEREFLDGWR
ncbi:alginate O-acetyltransferase AlgX-related protein [Roseococcus thiosulfatophilus]|uniref:alginate O-acetyltransferase AlgX-related protein n=1 Tax=Roseococcus thiosulfatophilus TaxID=35813 RepID=UPI001A8C938C|nr:cell division protein FtsQ [Roseococcus thiosulfatophilus]